jgi:hypothetical protein
MLRIKRSAHAWNAFVSKELSAVNKGMLFVLTDDKHKANKTSGLPQGSRHRLTTFMRENHAQLKAKYFQLSLNERKKLEEELTATRTNKESCKRANPKAMQKDINTTFKSLDQEVSSA